MKIRFLTLGVIFALLMASPSFAATSSHTNVSHDEELISVSYASSGVLVPFILNGQITMNIKVDYPGKIISYEDIYGCIPAGNQLPFSYSWSAGNIKYYKDGAYLSTHSLPLQISYISSTADRTFMKGNRPNSDLSADHTYKAVGTAIYSSSSTIPRSRVVDTTEGVVD